MDAFLDSPKPSQLFQTPTLTEKIKHDGKTSDEGIDPEETEAEATEPEETDEKELLAA